jgi:hypothetical protein
MADTMIYIPNATMGLTALNPMGFNFIPSASLTLTPLNPSGVVHVPRTARSIFRCILTGAENGLDDLHLPISAFNATVRDGDPSYLSCKVPNGSEYEADILLRPDGDIVVRCGVILGNGTEYTEEIVRVNYEDMLIERTSSIDNLTINGHKTRTLGQSKDWSITGVSFYSMNASGKRRVRGDIDFQLSCGDICTYGDGVGENIVVGAISYAVQALPAMAFMEIEEA